jgi:uncharacterized protein (TIGR03435 family)
MRRGLALVAIVLAGLGFGQEAAPSFEVASIKPSTEPPGIAGVTTKTGRLSGHNVTLKHCIRSAYSLPYPQILGGPKWLDEDRYQIDAKAAAPAGDRELSLMLRTLLAERFKLVLHEETRTMPGYALVVGKAGMKAKRSEPGGEAKTSWSRENLDAVQCTLADLARKLSDILHVPVSDFTAIEGAYDFQLKWTPEDMRASAPAAGNRPESATDQRIDPGTSLFAALQEQAGLKLETRKVPARVLIVDSAEKPAEN